MSGILGGGIKTTQPVALAGLQVQTSSYGIPIPIVYGAARTTMNIVEYTDFKAVKSSSGGGKSGKSGGSGSYAYSAAVAGAICEGPVVNASTTWVNQTAQPSSTAGFSFFNGVLGQSPWNYLAANHPDQAVPYSGLCYAGFGFMNLSTSATVPNYSFEIYGVLYATAPNGADADPSRVIPDLLSNAQYGAGFPASRIGSVVNNSEAHTVPASGPYAITVTNHASFNYHLDVEDAGGTPLTCVAGAPGPLQYAFNAATGVYTFNAAQAGAAITINYVSTGDLSNYQNFCLASGLWISPVYADQTQTSSLLDDIATYTYSEFVWSCGILTIVPRGSVAVAGNGHAYTPPSQAGFNLGDDDFVSGYAGGSSNDDPVLLKRTRISDQINDIKLEYLDRSNQYAPSIAEVSDQSLIDVYGRRADSSRQAHLFCDGNAANASAQLLLQKQYILNTYTFGLDARYCLFDPMDLDNISDAGIGLSLQPVRIVEITENDDGSVTIVAEEYPVSLGQSAEYTINQGSGYTADYNVSPGSTNLPLIYEPPPNYLAANSKTVPQIMIGASGANPNWGGCDVYISLDNVDYQWLGHIPVGARQGVTTAVLPSVSDPDTTSTLAVDLTESLGVLASVSTLNADSFISECLCLVQNADGADAELVSFATATLTGANKYSLTYLRRGVYGTASATHASGSVFCLLDDRVFSFPLPLTPVSYIGKTLYIKLLSVNIYGGAQQSLADVSPSTYIPTGIGSFVAPPTGIGVTMSYDLQSDGTVISTIDVGWTASVDPLFDQYEVQYKPHSASWGAATGILVKSGTVTVVVKPVQTGIAYDVRVRAIRSAGPAGGPFTSAWDEIDDQVTVGKGAGPTDPSGLTATSGVLANQLVWTASPDDDIAGYRVYRGVGATFAAAGEIAFAQTTAYSDALVTAGIAYYYWVEAVDTSGNASTAIGPVSATAVRVLASYLGAGNTANMIPDPNFADPAYWSLNQTTLPAGTIYFDTGYFPSLLSVAKCVTWNLSLIPAPASGFPQAATLPITVAANTQYLATVNVLSQGGANKQVQINAEFYGAGGGFISGAGQGVLPQDGVVQTISFVFTTPANCAAVIILLDVNAGLPDASAGRGWWSAASPSLLPLVNTDGVTPNAITNQVATFGYGGDQWVPCFISYEYFYDASPLIYCTGATLNIEVTCTIGNAINPSSAPGGSYPALNGYPFDAPAQIILDLYRLNFGTAVNTHIAGVVLSIGGGSQYTDPGTGVVVTNGAITFSTQDTPPAGGYEFAVTLKPYGSLTTGATYNIPFSNFTCTVLELKR